LSAGKKRLVAESRSSGKLETPTGRESGPSYRHPPVDEVVCGIRFELLGAFKVPHIGLLWSKFRSEYPNIEHAAPIAHGGNLVVDGASGAPLPRIWFINASNDELIQFQTDQLYFNWRRREREYPRFKTIFRKFESTKNVLEELLKELAIPPLVIEEHELTYINHIPHGEGWDSITDLPKLLPYLAWNSDTFKFLPQPRNLAWNMRFPLPDEQGNLDIKLTQGTRRTDKHPILLLQLSATGKAVSASWDASQAWYRMAHDHIVYGFSEITAPDAQKKIWQREDV